MKTVVSSAANYTSLTSVSQSTYIGQQHSTSAIYGGSLQQQQQQQPAAAAGAGSVGSTTAVGSGGTRTNQYQYQYYTSQSQPVPASQHHIAHYYTGSQVSTSYLDDARRSRYITID